MKVLLTQSNRDKSAYVEGDKTYHLQMRDSHLRNSDMYIKAIERKEITEKNRNKSNAMRSPNDEIQSKQKRKGKIEDRGKTGSL